MITVDGDVAEKIYIFNDRKHDLVVSIRRTGCRVVGCLNGHLYGYNFCNRHQWILPVPAEKCPHGFQVALIEYWKNMEVKVVHTHIYEGQKLSLKFRIIQFWKKYFMR